MPAITPYTNPTQTFIQFNGITHGGPDPSSNLGTQIKGAFSSSNEAGIQNSEAEIQKLKDEIQNTGRLSNEANVQKLEAEIQNIGRLLHLTSHEYTESGIEVPSARNQVRMPRETRETQEVRERQDAQRIREAAREIIESSRSIFNPKHLNSQSKPIKVDRFFIDYMVNPSSIKNAPTIRNTDIHNILQEETPALAFWINQLNSVIARETPGQGYNLIDSKKWEALEKHGKDFLWGCLGFFL